MCSLFNISNAELICHLLVLLGAHHILHVSRTRFKRQLNPICHLLALLGAHHILHVSRIRVNRKILQIFVTYFTGALDVNPL